MDKRYQVFVSSTYSDLREERQQIIEALLELDCIPSGMELFPAADEDQWSLIRRVIDDCDYYIMVIAGRYGSVGPVGKSFTQMEYEYAIGKGKPVLAFLHRDPASLPQNKTERSVEGQKALQEFRLSVEKRLCKYWTNADELGSIVSRSLVKLMKSRPGVGWVRASTITSEKVLLRLRTRLLSLERRLGDLRPTGLLRVTTSPYSDVNWGELFRQSKHLDLFFSYAQTWRNSHTEELEALARTKDATIRMVLPDPENHRVLQELATRSRFTDDEMKERIYEAAAQILKLQHIRGAEAAISVFLTPVVPLFSLFRFDHTAVMPLYTHRKGRRTLVVTLIFGEGILMDYASSEFEALMEEGLARRVDLDAIRSQISGEILG